MNNPTVVFFGSSQLSAEILQKLIDDGRFEIKAVVTRADKPVGRAKILTATPVAVLAEQKNIPVLKPVKLDDNFVDAILKLVRDDSDLIGDDNIDLFVVAAYGKIIPQTLLDIPKKGAINVHGSLLPKYRGASPIQSAILNGDEKTGVTIMLMDSEMDHGAMLAKSEIEISETETFETLEEKMTEVGGQLLIETLDKFLNNQIQAETQDETQATYCKLIKKSDGYFEIDNPPSLNKLDQMIRAYYPWPNVWTVWTGGRGKGKGLIVKFYPEGKMQMEGKNIVSREEFLRGYPDFPIKQF